MEQSNLQEKRLYRSRTNRIIFGVCGGLGEYFNIDPIIFRIIFIALTLGAGSGVLIYILLAFLTPKAPISGITNQEPQPINVKDRVEGLASELKELENLPKRRNFFGIAIVILGVFLLFNQLLPWKIFSWGVLWAALIIFLGVMILRGGGEYSKKSQDTDENSTKENFEPVQESGVKEKETVKEIHHYHHKNNGGIFRLFFGLTVLIIGFGFLAQNFNLISGLNLDLSALLKFWPAFIILAGLSILSRGTWLGSLLSIVITLIIVVLFALYFFWPSNPKAVEMFSFDIPKQDNMTRAEIFIRAGASVVDISGGATTLATGYLESNVSTLKTSSDVNDGVQRARIEMEGDVSKIRGKTTNTLNFKLAENIPLSIDMESGASNLTLDASNLILEEFKLSAGASKVMLTFGDKADIARATIEAGVSSIEIVAPESVGVKIEAEVPLSQKSFIDFKQTGEKTYETDGYAISEKKLDIFIKAGVSNISVIRK